MPKPPKEMQTVNVHFSYPNLLTASVDNGILLVDRSCQ